MQQADPRQRTAQSSQRLVVGHEAAPVHDPLVRGGAQLVLDVPLRRSDDLDRHLRHTTGQLDELRTAAGSRELPQVDDAAVARIRGLFVRHPDGVGDDGMDAGEPVAVPVLRQQQPVIDLRVLLRRDRPGAQEGAHTGRRPVAHVQCGGGVLVDVPDDRRLPSRQHDDGQEQIRVVDEDDVDRAGHAGQQSAGGADRAEAVPSLRPRQVDPPHALRRRPAEGLERRGVRDLVPRVHERRQFPVTDPGVLGIVHDGRDQDAEGWSHGW